ncbi:MAG: NAD-dependent epimerase/dehydratase family protein, partial [Desulfosarcinaceae bacterium]
MQLPFSKALVTGGAGFIGSHLAEALVQGGCEVIVVDNLSSGHEHNLEGFRDRINFVHGDIRDGEALAGLCQGCDLVFHQAAVVSVTKTVEDPVASTLVNDIGTLQVLDAARRSGVKRVVLASSSAVYGDDPQLPKVESMLPRPQSPYAVQKLTNEHYARLYHGLYGLETVCLRYFNVFGPRQDPSSPYSGVISIFMTKAARAESPVIYRGRPPDAGFRLRGRRGAGQPARRQFPGRRRPGF